MKKAIFFVAALLLPALAAGQNFDVKKVHIIFKTHLDIGYTDLSSKVEQKYISNFIPKAIAAARYLRESDSEHRYIWTTGSWLIWKYLQTADREAVADFEKAIADGDIVWNGVPYTTESEVMSSNVFRELLTLSRRLDEKYGKTTIAAKMTDVPGQTRSIIAPLADAGIEFLHIGVNEASQVPEVPELSVWRDTNGREVILAYQNGYGDNMILPSGDVAVSINFTGDNIGPHNIEQIHFIYLRLSRQYPNAELVASTLNDVAKEILPYKSTLPVVTSEIGDTWIHGYASAPLRMAKFKALSRLYDDWVSSGRLDPDSDEAFNFALTLGMVAEHTWGLDVKVHLNNWDAYDPDVFNEARRSRPEFQYIEQAWKEQDDYVDQAIAVLPPKLRKEAVKAMREIDNPRDIRFGKSSASPLLAENGEFSCQIKDVPLRLGKLTYQTYAKEEFDRFIDNYVTTRYDWALQDFAKPGMENSQAESLVVDSQVKAVNKKGKNTLCLVEFPETEGLDVRVLPRKIFSEFSQNGEKAEYSITILDKPANRLPEAYWLTFTADDIRAILAEKLGEAVDLSDVVARGNRQMHGVDNYVELVTPKGTVRITSLDAPVMGLGDADILNYSTQNPDVSNGIRFCLMNNVWGTNFAMWSEGSVKFRFLID